MKKVFILPLLASIGTGVLSLFFEQALFSNLSPFLSMLFRGLVTSILTFVIIANIELLYKVQKSLRANDANKIVNDIKSQIDDDFLEIFDDYFKSTIHNIESAIKSRHIVIYNSEQFHDFYRRVLEKYPKTRFWATSLVHPNYFWGDKIKNGSVEQATKNFTDGQKSDFIRIFFISEQDKRDLDRIKTIFDNQKKIGVNAFFIETKNPHFSRDDHYRLILVSKNKKFAWEVFTDLENHISKVIITVDLTEIKSYLKIFSDLKELYKPCDDFEFPLSINE